MASWTISQKLNEFEISGQGLFTGECTRVLVRSSPDPGIQIHWQGQLWYWGVGISLVPWVRVESRTTCLYNGEQLLWCVEHFCAAMATFLHEDLEIWIEGGEIPFLDGSAWLWYDLLSSHLGLSPKWHYLPVKQELSSHREYGFLQIQSAPLFSLNLSLKTSAGLTQQILIEDLELEWKTILQARSFIDEDSWNKAQEVGVMPGAVEGSGIVYSYRDDQLSVLHGLPLRTQDEMIRHKVLDFVGDMALGGGLPRGKVNALNPGHQMHFEILQKL